MEIVHPTDDDYELDFETDLRAQDAWRESQLMQETGGLGSMARGIMRPGGRHTIVCRHWLRDLCMKGDKCDFLHQYDLARMPECVQWSRFGKCPDNDCDFRHDTEKMECQKYKFGFCKLGSQCRMRHDKLSRPYLPEVVPDWFLKEICPNFFDLVPKLPEELVRASGQEDHPMPQAFPLMPQGGQPAWQQPAAPQPVVGTDSNWAVPTMPSWGAPVAPRAQQGSTWNAASKTVVDLTEDKAQRVPRSRRDAAPQAAPERRREAPQPESRDRRAPEPRARREEERPRARRDEERYRDERPREVRRDDTRGRERREEERSRPRHEDERVRREEDVRGDRRRSRSYDRKRDDRHRSRR